MVFQVQELSSGTMGHSEVDVYLQCILGLQSQSIDFTNAFAQADIPSGEPLFIEITRNFKSDGSQHDVFLRLNKKRIWSSRSRTPMV